MTTVDPPRTRSRLRAVLEGPRATSPEAMVGSARWFTGALLGLMALGAVVVAGATGAVDADSGRPGMRLEAHLLKLAIALGMFLMGARVRPRWLLRGAPLVMGGALVLLVVTLVVAEPINGSRRWLPFGPLTLQASEFARLAVIVSLGAWVALAKDAMGRLVPGLLLPGVIVAVPALLVLLEPDYGSTVYLIFVSAVVLFVGGASTRHLMFGFGGALVAASLYGLLNLDHVSRRVDGFSAPKAGSQVWQGLVSLGAGGVEGTGLGTGRGAWGWLPEAENDFILAVLGEELGLLGGLLLLGLYGLLLFHGTRLLLGTRHLFALVTGAGLLFQIMVQALLNLAVVTALAPPKGLPLPFISMGGSSLLVLSASCGLLLGLARYADEDPGVDGRWPITRLARWR